MKNYSNLNTGSQNWEEIGNKKLREVNCFNIALKNIKSISRFYEEFRKFRKKYNKNPNRVSITIDSIKIIGSTSTSITLSSTGFKVSVVPTTAGVGFGVAITTK